MVCMFRRSENSRQSAHSCIRHPVTALRIAERHTLLFGSRATRHGALPTISLTSCTFRDEVMRELLWKLVKKIRKFDRNFLKFYFIFFLSTVWKKKAFWFRFEKKKINFGLLFAYLLLFDERILWSVVLPRSATAELHAEQPRVPQSCDSAEHPSGSSAQPQCFPYLPFHLRSPCSNFMQKHNSATGTNHIFQEHLWWMLRKSKWESSWCFGSQLCLKVSTTTSGSSLHSAVNSQNPTRSQDIFPNEAVLPGGAALLPGAASFPSSLRLDKITVGNGARGI